MRSDVCIGQVSACGQMSALVRCLHVVRCLHWSDVCMWSNVCLWSDVCMWSDVDRHMQVSACGQMLTGTCTITTAAYIGLIKVAAMQGYCTQLHCYSGKRQAA